MTSWDTTEEDINGFYELFRKNMRILINKKKAGSYDPAFFIYQ